MSDLKEQIKIILLAVIAGTLAVQTFYQSNSMDSVDNGDTESIGQTANTVLPQNLNATPDPQLPDPVKEQKPTGPITSLSFAKESFDFGNIKQNSTDNKHKFKFTNTGTNPLVVENAKGSCGCTVPQWPKEPIPPGGTGEIVVEYKPGKQKGSQRKTVTVTANTEPRDTRITISAVVEEVPE